MPRLIDTHCHLDDDAGVQKELFARARDRGVERIVLVGYDRRANRRVIEVANRAARDGAAACPELFAAVGVHPHDAKTAPERSALLSELGELVREPRVCAVGEAGLDFFYDHSERDVQRAVFAAQIDFAHECGKPLVVHLRDARDRAAGDAYGEGIDLLAKEKISKVVLHCFSGSMDDARRAINLGFYLSFAGPVTYPKSDALREIAAWAPIERGLCETDSPYLAPQRLRGRTNEPANVADVYEQVARARGMELDAFAEAVWRNANTLFGLNDFKGN